jgi:Tol biopolymer transport system component
MLSILLIAVTLVMPMRSPSAAPATTESTIVLQTAGAPVLQTTAEVVSNQLGNQTNPHVQCNQVSYTFDDFQGISTIHYHDMATGADNVIPGNQVDLLSDISGSRVAYTEVTFTGDTIRIFDTISQTQTIVPGLRRSNPSIGGNIVAFEDRSSSIVAPQIALYDLSTGTVTPLTNDSLTNLWPNVSPNGDVVVWDKCQPNAVNCAAYAAVQTAPGVFTTRALTEVSSRGHLPFTNGEIAVYVSDRSGENDIYYQTLAGGAEVHLAIPGDQRWARISGDLISFESHDQNGYDIFVYDIRTGQLSRVTNTIGIDETLSEISVCGGAGRIVYSIPGDGSFDVYAVSFSVPSVTEDQIDDLIALVGSFNLPPGTANSLVTKLQSALTAIDSSDTATACSLLTDFTNECAAQSGKKLTTAQANQLINSANAIKTNLGCL